MPLVITTLQDGVFGLSTLGRGTSDDSPSAANFTPPQLNGFARMNYSRNMLPELKTRPVQGLLLKTAKPAA